MPNASPILIPTRDFDSSFSSLFHDSTFTESECDSSYSVMGSSLIADYSSFSFDSCSNFSLSPSDAISILRNSFLSTLLIDLQWHKKGKQKPMIPGARIIQDFLQLRSEYEDMLLEVNTSNLTFGDDDLTSECLSMTIDGSKQLRSIYSVFDLSTIIDCYFARRKDAIIILYDETGEENSFSSQLASILNQEGISKGIYYVEGGANSLLEAFPKLFNTSSGEDDDEIQIKVSSLVSKIQQKITIYTLRSRQFQLVNAVWYGVNSDIPARILPGLFLGSCLVATSKHVEKLKITHILRFGSGFENHCQPSTIYHYTMIPDELDAENSNNGVIYYDFPIEDTPSTPINTLFHNTAQSQFFVFKASIFPILYLFMIETQALSFYVNIGGSGNGSLVSPFGSVNDAANAVNVLLTNPQNQLPKDVDIFVQNGTYSLQTTLTFVNIPFNLNIVGLNPGEVILTCPINNNGHISVSFDAPNSQNITLQNLILADCKSSQTYPITVSKFSNFVMKKVTVSNNLQSGAVYLSGSSSAIMQDVLLIGNSPMDGDVSCGLSSVDNSSFYANGIEIDCSTTFGTGIVISSTGQSGASNLFIHGASSRGESSGSAINITSGSTQISNAKFQDNSAIQGGAVFVSNAAILSISNATFSNTTALEGGVIYAEKQGNFNCQTCTFSDFKSNTTGGCISLTDFAVLQLKYTTFRGNYKVSANTGSILHMTDFAIVNAEDVFITGAVASTGTIVFLNGITANFTRLQVSNNYNQNSYGGLFFGKLPGAGSVINVYDSFFQNLTQGQATFASLDHGEMNVFNSVINASTTPNGGGAVAVQANGGSVIFRMKDSTIMNSAGYWGGCVSQYGGYLSFDNVTLFHNAIAWSTSSFFQNPGTVAVINNSRIIENGFSPLVDPKYWSAGSGAVAIYGAMTIQNTIFSGNRAGTFGAIIVRLNANAYFKNITVANHVVTSNAGGIKVDSGFNGNLTIEDSLFENNRVSGNGAAIFIDTQGNPNLASITMRRVTFRNNTALFGGALYSRFERGWPCVDCSFINNTALVGGGALFTKYPSQEVMLTGNTIFAGNKASYGADISTEPVAAAIQSMSLDNTKLSNFSSLSLYSGSLLQNITVIIVDGLGQTYISITPLRSSSTSTLILTQFIIPSNPNSTISGDSAALCWKGQCQHSNIAVIGLPGNYIMNLRFAQYGSFNMLKNFQISIPVTIKSCPNDSLHIVQNTTNSRFQSCTIPFCSECKNGKCVSDNVCQCYDTWWGSNCDQRFEFTFKSSIRVSLITIAIISILFSLFNLTIVVIKQKEHIIRRSNPIFLVLMCVGSTFRFATIIAEGLASICIVVLWFKVRIKFLILESVLNF
ncbi:hypothetical protein HK096_003902 [Nowakowskiella sp. JEL0078]|nr:hypothetical protein HK096_003902 [Nowakowskiella sp. JEL0078]